MNQVNDVIFSQAFLLIVKNITIFVALTETTGGIPRLEGFQRSIPPEISLLRFLGM